MLQNVELSYEKTILRTLIEDKDYSLLLKLKKVTIKHVNLLDSGVMGTFESTTFKKILAKPLLTAPIRKIKLTMFLSLYNMFPVVKNQVLMMLISGCQSMTGQ